MNRSFLFVPGDSEKKFAKALDSGADALIIDLEDAVSPANKAAARGNLTGFLGAEAKPELWVRINALDTGESAADLDALSGCAPAGVVLPKASGAGDVRRLADRLSRIGNHDGRPPIPILPLVTERPAALFRVEEYATVSEQLYGLTWGAEDLAAALGASANRDALGTWYAAFQLARSLCLIGAAAAGVPAIETVYTELRNYDGLVAFARAARRDGFSGMLAIHPAQLEAIHEAFTPGSAEIERARRIVALFDDDPEAGVVELDGSMVDRPHYEQARRLLDVARRLASR